MVEGVTLKDLRFREALVEGASDLLVGVLGYEGGLGVLCCVGLVAVVVCCGGKMNGLSLPLSSCFLFCFCLFFLFRLESSSRSFVCFFSFLSLSFLSCFSCSFSFSFSFSFFSRLLWLCLECIRLRPIVRGTKFAASTGEVLVAFEL